MESKKGRKKSTTCIQHLVVDRDVMDCQTSVNTSILCLIPTILLLASCNVVIYRIIIVY